jgi:catechol 2,3-dioxygenase-like lactoylglutathione lyase family enzyme
MLGSVKPIAFVPSTDAAQSRHFFGEVLGLRFVADDGFALVFEADGVMMRVVNVKGMGGFQPAPFTILGWEVPDAEESVRELAGKGVEFLRVDGLPQDEHGIWDAPGGAKVAWFKDPTGNTLSISQH